MRKLLASTSFFLALSASAFQLENPSDMRWGGRFIHFACERFSTTPTSVPTAHAESGISLHEFGTPRDLQYGVFNAFFGPDGKCEYRVKMLRRKETQTLEFVTSEVSTDEECAQGKQVLDGIFGPGMEYAETGRGHRYLSFRPLKSMENSCAVRDDLTLEYQRIR